MKIFIKHILRNLEEKMGRTLLITFALMGVSIVVSFCFIMVSGVAEMLESAIRNASFYDYMIYSTRMPLSYEKLESMDVDMDFLGLNAIERGYRVSKKKSAISLSTFDFEKAKQFKLLDTFDDFKLEDDEALVTQAAANIIGVYKNQEFTFYNCEDKPFKLKMKYVDHGKLQSAGAFIFVNENTYKKISSNTDEETKYSLFFGKYTGKQNIKDFNKKLYEIEDEYGYDFEYINIMEEMFGDFKDTFKLLMLLIILGSVIIFFVLNSIVKIIMEERIPIVGSFRSVGATNLKMNLLLVCEMGTYGLIGGLAGSCLSASLLGNVFSMVAQMQVMLGVYEGTNTPLVMIIITTIMMILFQVILSISEILSFNSMTIKECMFNSKQRRFKRNTIKLFIGIVALVITIYSSMLAYQLSYTFGLIAIISTFTAVTFLLPYITYIAEKIFKRESNPLLTMAFNTINANKLQVSTNVIICILITISISLISILSAYITENNKKLNYVKSDIYVESNLTNIQNEIMAIDNVSTISSLFTTSSDLSNLKLANNSISLFDIVYSDNVEHLEESCGAVKTDFNKWKNLKNNEIIIDEYYIKKFNLKIGDIVKISFGESTKHFDYSGDIDLKIVGISNTNILTQETAMKNASPSSQELFINLKDPSKSEDTVKEIKKLISELDDKVQTKEEYIKATKTANKLIISGVFTIIGLIVAVGLVGIVNNQTVALIERSKELAILYSTCMSRKQLSSMILREIGISYIISAIFSICFGYLLAKILKYTFDTLTDGFVIQVEFNILWIFILLIFIAIIMSVIYLVIKKKIKHMNIVEELKYE